MIISIDTEKIRTAAALIQNANTEIDTCSSVLVRVVEHDDWNCKERDVINESIAEVKKYAGELRETMDTFSTLMTRVAASFDELDALIPKQFAGMEAVLGDVFSTPTPYTAANATIGGMSETACAKIAEDIYVDGGIENIALETLDKPIQMCSFSDVDFIDE